MRKNNGLILDKPAPSLLSFKSTKRFKLININRKTLALTPRVSDPFLDMINKANKSPLLKPVFARPGNSIQRALSDSSINKTKLLPPISPTYTRRLNLEIPTSDRLWAKTPNFNGSIKPSHTALKFRKPVNNDVSFGEPTGNINYL